MHVSILRAVVTLCALASVLMVGTYVAQVNAADEAAKPQPHGGLAVCTIRPLGDGSHVQGKVTFMQTLDGVKVTAELTGLTPGEHGFHVHDFGDCSMMDGTCAGGHFNPTGAPHGGPDSAERHVGDLGNIKADSSGTATYDRVDKLITLSGPHSIIGRSIIVHADPDDLTTQPTGNAGARIGCGVIGIADPNMQH
jgi:Cu-Zn family superoxide dismutase